MAASTIFFFSLMGPLWTAPDPELLAMIATFPGPNLLLGLLAFQIASRSGRIGRLAAIVARPAGVLLAAGYAYVLVDTWGDVIPVAFGACGVVACALLIVIPARHGSPVVKHATAAATVASAGPPGSLCATLLPFSYVPDLWEGMLTVVACLLPLVGCIALLWLIYTEPGGEA